MVDIFVIGRFQHIIRTVMMHARTNLSEVSITYTLEQRGGLGMSSLWFCPLGEYVKSLFRVLEDGLRPFLAIYRGVRGGDTTEELYGPVMPPK